MAGSSKITIAIAQVNAVIGDFARNRELIRLRTTQAKEAGAQLVVFPELSLCGYPPMDLLDHRTFVEENLRNIRRLQQNLPEGIAVMVGYVDASPTAGGKALQNCVAVVSDGAILFRQAKRLLPTYDVFDEARYFEPARKSSVFTLSGIRIGVAICEDIWWETEPAPGTRYPVDPVRDLVDGGADLIVAPSASPFFTGKLATRRRLVQKIGRTNAVPAIYVNMVGANDSLIFDGHSFACDATGAIVHQSPGFVEDLALMTVEPAADHLSLSGGVLDDTDQSPEEETRQALVLGIRDYLAKTGFTRVHLGLSGGIDSAVVAVLATEAAGRENVRVFLMPSTYSSAGSVDDSRVLCENLGIDATILPITPAFEAFLETLSEVFAGREPNVAEENIQARIRGTLLMAFSNKTGSLTLTTGNKSELAVGYATMYGDMAGGLAVIGDLFKTEVYALARHINREREIIPEAILTKAPSAELRPDQQDEDSLPPYDQLDRILRHYLVESQTYTEIVAGGHEAEVVRRVLRLVGRAEYKRRQAPPVLKVSPRAFGTGRRIPIARSIYEESL